MQCSLKMRKSLIEIGPRLKHGAEIVLSGEITGITGNIVAREGLLKQQTSLLGRDRTAVRQNLQPEVGHFVGGAIATEDALRRIERIGDVVFAVVVDVAH